MSSHANYAPGTAHYPPEADDFTFGKVEAFRKEVQSKLDQADGEETQVMYKNIVAETVASVKSSSPHVSDKDLDLALKVEFSDTHSYENQF